MKNDKDGAKTVLIIVIVLILIWWYQSDRGRMKRISQLNDQVESYEERIKDLEDQVWDLNEELKVAYSEEE